MLSNEQETHKQLVSLVALRLKNKATKAIRCGETLSELDAHLLSLAVSPDLLQNQEDFEWEVSLAETETESFHKLIPTIGYTVDKNKALVKKNYYLKSITWLSVLLLMLFIFLGREIFNEETPNLGLTISEFEKNSDTPEGEIIGDIALSEEEIEAIQSFSTSIKTEVKNTEVINNAKIEIKEDYIQKEKKQIQNINTQSGMVQFITGVIAVHLPEATDSGKVAKEIVSVSKEEGIDPLFVAAVISVESRFSTKARSSVGAQGLMQLMPDTARFVANKIFKGQKKLLLSNSNLNIRLGINYLHQLSDMYRGDKKLALAAYNWGPANVSKAIKGEKRIPSSVNHYATTILRKTKAWNHHFDQAKE